MGKTFFWYDFEATGMILGVTRPLAMVCRWWHR